LAEDTALVTGGSRGIGRAIAAALTASGRHVTIIGRDRSALDAAIEAGVAADACVLDVTDGDALHDYVAGQGFAIVINNAGGVETKPFLQTDNDLLRRMFALNVESAATATRACLPAMIARGYGRIVNMASTAGLKGYAYVSAYVAAKHALVGLTRSIALEVARHGITINAVCPGYTDTDLVADSVRRIVGKTKRSEAETIAQLVSANPLRRLITPEEVADAVLWVCGRSASAINGQTIAVAGGEV
jgi:NAD(P)-dependent dehydrogenase (short-subunit alcohol dehydrogenase family)